MPTVSDRQKLLQDLEETLQLLSCFYALLSQQELDTWLFGVLRSSSGSSSSSSASSTSTRTSTSSSESSSSSLFEPAPMAVNRPSNVMLETLTTVYKCYVEVTSHRYLDRPHGMRQLHLHRDSFLGYLLDLEGRAFKYLFRMNRISFDRVCALIVNDPVFQNNSNSPQVDPRNQLAVALSRFGHDGNGSAIQNQRVLFSTSEGWIEESTWRVMEALLHLQQRFLSWPTQQQRRRISDSIGRVAPFHSCVGFVDGSIIPFAVKPATEDFADYYTRRKRVYGWNIVLVSDYNRRITGIHTGWVAAAHDQWVFASTPLHRRPGDFFSPGEYLLADSGYEASRHVVPAYKRLKGQPQLPPEEEAFNLALSRVRVRVEHTFGLMKSRFKSLEGLRVLLRTETDGNRSRLWVVCTSILHNILLDDPDDDFWEGEDMQALERQWEEAADAAREDRRAWEAANDVEAFVGDDEDQRTREYVRQFAEGVDYGPAYVGGIEQEVDV